MKYIRNIAKIGCLLFFLAGVGPAAAQQGLRVLCYNVYEGFQQDSLQQQKFKDWVLQFDPDVIAFQELNGFNHMTLEALARSYGHPYVAIQKDWGYPLGITSRYPITDMERRTDDFTLGYLYSRVQDYHIFIIHLNPFQYPKRNTQIRSILAQAARIPKKEKVMILGDFNSLSPADSMQYNQPARLARAAEFEMARKGQYDDYYLLNRGRLDYSVITTMMEAGYHDAFLLKNDTFTPTASTERYRNKPGPSGTDIRIDYIWLNKALRKKCARMEVIKDEVTHNLSDHYPLLMDISP